MLPPDGTRDNAPATALYTLVIVCEAAVIVALWLFGRVFA